MRRAAINQIDEDAPDDYCWDAVRNEEVLMTKTRGRDLRCVLQAINRMNSSHFDFVKEALIPGHMSGLVKNKILEKVIKNGVKEMTELIKEKGCKEVKKYVGL